MVVFVILTVASNMTTSNIHKMNCSPCARDVALTTLMKRQVVNEEPGGLKVEMWMLVLQLIVQLHHFWLLSWSQPFSLHPALLPLLLLFQVKPPTTQIRKWKTTTPDQPSSKRLTTSPFLNSLPKELGKWVKSRDVELLQRLGWKAFVKHAASMAILLSLTRWITLPSTSCVTIRITVPLWNSLPNLGPQEGSNEPSQEALTSLATNTSSHSYSRGDLLTWSTNNSGSFSLPGSPQASGPPPFSPWMCPSTR